MAAAAVALDIITCAAYREAVVLEIEDARARIAHWTPLMRCGYPRCIWTFVIDKRTASAQCYRSAYSWKVSAASTIPADPHPHPYKGEVRFWFVIVSDSLLLEGCVYLLPAPPPPSPDEPSGGLHVSLIRVLAGDALEAHKRWLVARAAAAQCQ
jgi:hypothetical protein